jgi:hypothetical protein
MAFPYMFEFPHANEGGGTDDMEVYPVSSDVNRSWYDRPDARERVDGS